jgi:hypothetical protein
MRGFDAHPAAPWDWAWITIKPEVYSGPEVRLWEVTAPVTLAIDFWADDGQTGN